MELLWISFFAGILTVLAPCVLPILPVILGGVLAEKKASFRRPLIICLSLGFSIIIFTFLLKISTIFIDIPSYFWSIISGGIITFFGITFLFPDIWTYISKKFGFATHSEQLLKKSSQKRGIFGEIAIGASLGPVFSSCSPTYFLILGIVLPADFFRGFFALIFYVLGVVFIMGLVSFFGQKIIKKIRWAADSKGIFRKILGVIFIFFGLIIFTGYDKKLEIFILEQNLFLGVTNIEKDLVKNINIDQFSSDSHQKEITETPKVGLIVPKKYSFDFPIRILAPNFRGLGSWINSSPISSIDDLRGKVVLIDFWTYTCINCIRTLPYIQNWHEKYVDQGLVVIGVHSPEFQRERKLENVQAAVKKRGLTYPVVQDNDFMTWKAYKNRYWPAVYLIDREGFMRYFHFGEGKYDEIERAIQALLE